MGSSRHSRLIENALDSTVMNTKLVRDGAGGPTLGVMETQNLRLKFDRDQVHLLC